MKEDDEVLFTSIPRRDPNAPRFSRNFLCALFGIGMTILARVGPWHWPGWPAVTLLDLYLGSPFAPTVAGPMTKCFGLVVLFLVNTGFWAAVAQLVVRVAATLRPPRV